MLQCWNHSLHMSKHAPARPHYNQVYGSTTDWAVKSFLGLDSHTIQSEIAWWLFVKLSSNEFHNYHFSISQVFIGTEISRWVIRKNLISNQKYVNTPNHKYSNNLVYFTLSFLNMARKIKHSWNQTNPYVHNIATTNKTQIKNNKLPPTKVKEIPLKLLGCLYKRRNGVTWLCTLMS